MLAARHHLDEGEIEQYSTGAIVGAACDSIENHLLICEICQDRVVQHDVYLDVMRAACAEFRAKPKRLFASFGWPWFSGLVPVAVAAAVFLIAGVFGPRLMRHRAAGPTVFVNLEAVRGSGVGSRAPAGRALTLHLDVSGVSQPVSQAEVVDATGRTVWKGLAPVSPEATATVNLPPITAGQYFVRVYSAGGDLLREYGLEIAR